tara:strand:- start:49 stop:240 length:192 start_codon:yes stop_codon:yes gene_type:complete
MGEINELVRYCSDFISDYWIYDVDDAISAAAAAGIVTAICNALRLSGSNNPDTVTTRAGRGDS